MRSFFPADAPLQESLRRKMAAADWTEVGIAISFFARLSHRFLLPGSHRVCFVRRRHRLYLRRILIRPDYFHFTPSFSSPPSILFSSPVGRSVGRSLDVSQMGGCEWPSPRKFAHYRGRSGEGRQPSIDRRPKGKSPSSAPSFLPSITDCMDRSTTIM